jgi:hypothetical protein
VHPNNILIYIQQDATLHSLFYLETALHVSGGYHHPSSGAQTTVSTASGSCQNLLELITGKFPNWFWVKYRKCCKILLSNPPINLCHMAYSRYLTIILLMWRIWWTPNSIPIYIQQDATLHSLFYLETALHVSGVTSTYHQERKQLYLQHLVFVTPLLLPAAIAADSSNGLTNNISCRYSCMRSWWWVRVPPETCRAVSR